MAEAGDEIIIRREGRAGRLTLDRPQALNAVTLAMIRAMRRTLDTWRNDPMVELVILDGAGSRALAAGGDLRSMFEARDDRDRLHRTFWREEYELNALIARYPKPYVAIMDGIVMGGGIGLSAHASHRIVTERSHLAMPETAIGLITDVGGTWLLAQAPGESGVYLGLTGARMSAGDAIWAGFADYFVAGNSLADLITRLCDGGREALAAFTAVDRSAPEPSGLADRLEMIGRTFGFARIGDIFPALAEEPGDWARETLAGIKARSPLATVATLTAIRNARTLETLEQALELEYRYVCRLFEGGEFIEGVRALVIDKDKTPRWRPARFEDVSEEMIAALGAPLTEGQAFRAGGD